MTSDSAPARFLWILRPPVTIDRRTERIFLLVGAAAFFAAGLVPVLKWASIIARHLFLSASDRSLALPTARRAPVASA